MSHNVEIVRELNRAFNRAEGWIDFYDPRAEVHVPPGLPDGTVFSGHDGIQAAAALWTDQLQRMQLGYREADRQRQLRRGAVLLQQP